MVFISEAIFKIGQDNMADNTGVREAVDSPVTSISADEAALYDRQIRLWGLDAQKRYNTVLNQLLLIYHEFMMCFSTH